jgi:[ribosomal protein S5]-alanine N-acetyltransferase
MFPDTFSTARLDARRLTAADIDEVRRMHLDPAVMTHLGGVRDEAETDEYMTLNLRHWATFNFGLWIVYERGSLVPVGRALLRHVMLDAGDEVEVGYALYPAFWGRGLATEIATACVRLGFDELHLPTIVALTGPANVASQRVLAKSGLTYERALDHHGARHLLYRARQSA